jgi:5-methylthioadenosine/S-adenosylhomocysteine deaminase
MVDGEEPLHDARVVISGDRITEVSASHNNFLPETNEIIYATDAILLPGLINTHCHSPMTLFRGIADDLSPGDSILGISSCQCGDDRIRHYHMY